jgi:hypothetical protein
MNRRIPVAFSLFLALTAAACASTAATGEEGTGAATVYVNVDNSARADLEVSILSGGQELRLGRVQVGDDQRFRVPAPVLRSPPYSFSVRLVARDGTGDWTTPSLVVNEGQNVYLDASPNLPSSRFTVR